MCKRWPFRNNTLQLLGVCSDEDCAYEFFSTKRTFEDAQENCAKIGKILAVPHNLAELKTFWETFSEESFDHVWMGTMYQCDKKEIVL